MASTSARVAAGPCRASSARVLGVSASGSLVVGGWGGGRVAVVGGCRGAGGGGGWAQRGGAGQGSEHWIGLGRPRVGGKRQRAHRKETRSQAALYALSSAPPLIPRSPLIPRPPLPLAPPLAHSLVQQLL